jgi:hypothetical protein
MTLCTEYGFILGVQWPWTYHVVGNKFHSVKCCDVPPNSQNTWVRAGAHCYATARYPRFRIIVWVTIKHVHETTHTYNRRYHGNENQNYCGSRGNEYTSYPWIEQTKRNPWTKSLLGSQTEEYTRNRKNRTEVGSNTSTVSLRVVGVDEKGSLKFERVIYGL